MSTLQTHSPAPDALPTTTQRRLRPRARALIVAIVALLALLSATVAIGQSSQDFDLACRGILASGGTVSSGGSFAVIGAFGIPFAPPKNSDTTPTYAVRSNDFAVRGGFLPGYPTGHNIAATGNAPTIDAQTNFQHLPWITKVGRIIRGGC